MGPLLFIFVNEPKLIEMVLNSPKCLEKSFLYKFLRLDKGLLAAKHESWQVHRKLLESSFHLDTVKNFIPIFIDSADQMISNINALEEKNNVNLFEITSRCALTMVLSSSFGLSAAEVHISDDMLKSVEELIKIISHRCREPVFYIERIYRFTRNYYREKKYRKRCYYYLDQVLKERRELVEPPNKNMCGPSTPFKQHDEEMGDPTLVPKKNFIDQLIFNEGKFSDEEIHDHIYTFVVAGYETTALQTAFTLLLLAMHDDVQNKLFEEIEKALPNKHSILDHSTLMKMKYLENVIKESMRLLPPVPLIGRETLEDLELDEVIVPKGVTLIIHFFNLHRKKEIWGDDAEEFNPDRFSSENENKRHPYSFLPFSGGSRDCIGKHYAMLAVKTILVKFLRNYKVSTDLKYDELTFRADITMKVCQDLKVNIEER
ncbi:CLUMA_CG012996, isoform A [Clunio marinus]|uniref:CLUMA_CG012996, isoform A n=1 Tax=Clunio marinus TaxID=568069 RepID=A0A1J1IIT6_9DIPT|nr:CLUMA_CG012996, isoform A [Clunio marinus]